MKPLIRLFTSRNSDFDDPSFENLFPNLANCSNIKEFALAVTGFDSPAVVRLLSEKILVKANLCEYTYPLPWKNEAANRINSMKTHLKSRRFRKAENLEFANLKAQAIGELAVVSGGLKKYAKEKSMDRFDFTDINNIVENETGTVDYLKYREVTEVDQGLLFKLFVAKGRLNVDRMQTLIREHKFASQKTIHIQLFIDEDIDTLMSIVKTEDGLLKFLNTITEIMHYTDTIRIWHNNTLEIPSRWRSAKDLHDKLARQERLIVAEKKNKPITYGPDSNMLDLSFLFKCDRMRLVVPRETKLMAMWGFDLNNCIGGYGETFAKGHFENHRNDMGGSKPTLQLILGLYINDEVAYGIRCGYAQDEYKATAAESLTPASSTLSPCIFEFRGKGNRAPDKELEEFVTKLILNAFEKAITNGLAIFPNLSMV